MLASDLLIHNDNINRQLNKVWVNTDALTNVKKNHELLTICAPSQRKEYHQKYCSARNHAKFAASELIKKHEMNLAKEIN